MVDATAGGLIDTISISSSFKSIADGSRASRHSARSADKDTAGVRRALYATGSSSSSWRKLRAAGGPRTTNVPRRRSWIPGKDRGFIEYSLSPLHRRVILHHLEKCKVERSTSTHLQSCYSTRPSARLWF